MQHTHAQQSSLISLHHSLLLVWVANKHRQHLATQSQSQSVSVVLLAMGLAIIIPASKRKQDRAILCWSQMRGSLVLLVGVKGKERE